MMYCEILVMRGHLEPQMSRYLDVGHFIVESDGIDLTFLQSIELTGIYHRRARYVQMDQ